METKVKKTKIKRNVPTDVPMSSGKTITENDIRRRAYEIYMENGVNSQNDLDNWLKAEKELKGFQEIT